MSLVNGTGNRTAANPEIVSRFYLPGTITVYHGNELQAVVSVEHVEMVETLVDWLDQGYSPEAACSALVILRQQARALIDSNVTRRNDFDSGLAMIEAAVNRGEDPDVVNKLLVDVYQSVLWCPTKMIQAMMWADPGQMEHMGVSPDDTHTATQEIQDAVVVWIKAYLHLLRLSYTADGREKLGLGSDHLRLNCTWATLGEELGKMYMYNRDEGPLQYLYTCATSAAQQLHTLSLRIVISGTIEKHITDAVLQDLQTEADHDPYLETTVQRVREIRQRLFLDVCQPPEGLS